MNMKTHITFFILTMLSIVVTAQTFQNGREYKAQNITYKCRVSSTESHRSSVRSKGIEPTWSTGPNYFFYQFSNVNNVLRGTNPMPAGTEYGITAPSAVFESERRLLELLKEAYSGKEKMQTMGDEVISLDFCVGMDGKVKEVQICIYSLNENIKTTLLQVEAMERQIKERIRFNVYTDRSNANAIWTLAHVGYTISVIPDLLENKEVYDPIVSKKRKLED